MLFDSILQLSDQQAITASAASTNVLDFLAPQTPVHGKAPIARDLGKGTDFDMRIQVTEAFNTLTSLTVSIQGSVDAAFTSPVTLQTSPAVPLASLVPGYVFPMDDLEVGSVYEFVRVYYTVAGVAPTTGKVSAGVVFDNDERW